MRDRRNAERLATTQTFRRGKTTQPQIKLFLATFNRSTAKRPTADRITLGFQSFFKGSFGRGNHLLTKFNGVNSSHVHKINDMQGL